MKIKEYIKQAHDTAVEKGFYDCKGCEGTGEVWVINKGLLVCMKCNGTGKDQNKNIGELLALVCSEFIGEGLEAHRCGRFANWEEHYAVDRKPENFIITRKEADKWMIDIFERDIKDTFEDEMADTFIRLFDLCGYLKLDDNMIYNSFKVGMYSIVDEINVGEWMFNFILYSLGNIKQIISHDWSPEGTMGGTLASLYMFCQKFNIPIEKHIEAKMQYNKTRPKKHGKEY